MTEPLAYFLTWTTYGTWFHGDERGSVDPDHNRVGSHRLPANAQRVLGERSLMRADPYLLDHARRLIIERAIRDHSEFRSWRLLAVNARSNHVHVVITAPRYEPEPVMDQLKGWGTRRLRETNQLGRTDPAWTIHGSTRWLWDQDSVARAVDYVVRQQ